MQQITDGIQWLGGVLMQSHRQLGEVDKEEEVIPEQSSDEIDMEVQQQIEKLRVAIESENYEDLGVLKSAAIVSIFCSENNDDEFSKKANDYLNSLSAVTINDLYHRIVKDEVDSPELRTKQFIFFCRIKDWSLLKNLELDRNIESHYLQRLQGDKSPRIGAFILNRDRFTRWFTDLTDVDFSNEQLDREFFNAYFAGVHGINHMKSRTLSMEQRNNLLGRADLFNDPQHFCALIDSIEPDRWKLFDFTRLSENMKRIVFGGDNEETFRRKVRSTEDQLRLAGIKS